jgi:hypothetical protein
LPSSSGEKKDKFNPSSDPKIVAADSSETLVPLHRNKNLHIPENTIYHIDFD